jgi:hypothetical protein
MTADTIAVAPKVVMPLIGCGSVVIVEGERPRMESQAHTQGESNGSESNMGGDSART